MSFGQLPFLPLIEAVPAASEGELLAAIARIAPFLVAASVAEAVVPVLPSPNEYYIYQDTDLSLDEAVAFLDRGARKIVLSSVDWLGQLPAERVILRLPAAADMPAAALARPELLASISGVLVETSTFNEPALKAYRDALKLGPGRPRELFILSQDRSPDVVLHQPAALKLMTRSVNAHSVLPLAFLSAAVDPVLDMPHARSGKLSVATLFISLLRSDRKDALYATIPVSVTSTPAPLGLVYSSSESVAHSIASGNAVYFSRSRNGLWRKGETSGAMQRVERIRFDCDADALEFAVTETGPTGERDGFCHVPGQTSCFGPVTGLAELEATLKARKASAPPGSYTARLFSEPKLVRAKIMEEAGELCEAETKDEIAGEAADLIYFALTRCVASGVGLKDIAAVLERRSLKVTRRKGDAKPEWIEKLGLDTSQALGVVGGAPMGGAVTPETAATPVSIREPYE